MCDWSKLRIVSAVVVINGFMAVTGRWPHYGAAVANHASPADAAWACVVVLTSVCASAVYDGVSYDVDEMKSMLATKTIRLVLKKEPRRLRFQAFEFSQSLIGSYHKQRTCACLWRAWRPCASISRWGRRRRLSCAASPEERGSVGIYIYMYMHVHLFAGACGCREGMCMSLTRRSWAISSSIHILCMHHMHTKALHGIHTGIPGCVQCWFCGLSLRRAARSRLAICGQSPPLSGQTVRWVVNKCIKCLRPIAGYKKSP